MPFSNINPNEHASTKVNTSIFNKGGVWGDSPLETRYFFLKKISNKNRGFFFEVRLLDL